MQSDCTKAGAEETAGTAETAGDVKKSPLGKGKLTLGRMIAKRKQRWAELHDPNFDAALVRASAERILGDPSLVAEVLEKPHRVVELWFSIVDKHRRTVPFFFNEVQADFVRRLEEEGTRRPFFILKGRQQGFTSLITAIQLANAITRRNFAGFTLADRRDNAEAIFNDKARMVYDQLPSVLKPHEKFNSMRELFFDHLNSSWRIATATRQVGRSRTLSFVHLSEAAFYDCSLSDLQAGIGEAIVQGATVIYETTANGFNETKELWDSGACVNLFYPWWRTAEYRSRDFSALDNADSWLSGRIRMLREIGLDREQIAWYAKKYASYLDKSRIRQEYPCNPEEAFVASAGSLFDAEAVANQLTRIGREAGRERRGEFTYRKVREDVFDPRGGEAPGESFRIEEAVFREKPDGMIVIHEEPQVKRDNEGYITHRCPYVIGGDTAGSGEDYFTAKVVNCLTGRTAATLHKQRLDEDLYAEQLLCLAEYYHHALIGVETNYSRVPINVIVKKYGYDHVYMRERFDRLTDTLEQVPGFETTRSTKPNIIGNLVAIMRENPTLESDPETLKEMLVFVHKDNGKLEALDGCHDDLVMALAIAHHIRGQQVSTWMEDGTGEAENERFAAAWGLDSPRGNRASRAGGEDYSEYMDWEDD